LRHSGTTAWWQLPISTARTLSGGALVGTFGGTALFVKWNKCHDLVTGKVPAPNEILCGPRYR
jgi:hypothetical protein